MCQLGYLLNKTTYKCDLCDEKTNGYCRESASNKFCVSFYQDGCTLYSADGCSCATCNVNYNNVNGNCVPKAYGCSAYGGNGECVECYGTHINALYPAVNGVCYGPPSAGDAECPEGWEKNDKKQCIYKCTNGYVNKENNGCGSVDNGDAPAPPEFDSGSSFTRMIFFIFILFFFF